MVHGQPDYGLYAAKKTVFGLADLGELAARLGSVVTFDRRGDVMLFDDFEDNLNKWQRAMVGIGAAIVLSNTQCRNGSRSVKVTSGNVIGNASTLTRFMAYPVVSKMGFEISFTYHANFLSLEWIFTLYDGTNYHQGRIKYTDATGALSYQDSAGAYQVIVDGLSLYNLDFLFHTIKMVVDFTTDKYARLILNNIEYDLSDYGLYAPADAGRPRVQTQLRVITATAANNSMYYDDAIWTQNEP